MGEGMIKMRREEGAIERNRQGKNRDEARLDSKVKLSKSKQNTKPKGQRRATLKMSFLHFFST